MCLAVISATFRHVGQCKKPTALQSSVAGQVGELLVDVEVISEFFLTSVVVLDINGHSDHFGHKKNLSC